MEIVEEYDVAVTRSLIEGQHNSLAPIFPMEFSAYFQKPEVNFPATYFFSVFTLSFWMGIVFVFVLVLCFIALHVKYYKLNISKTITLLMQFYGITSSDVEISLNILSYNIALVFVNIFMFFISSSFSVFLIAKLAVFNFDLPFDTFSDLLHQTQYEVCSRPMSTINQVFKTNNKYMVKINSEKCKPDEMQIVDRWLAESYLKDTICNDKLVYISETEIMDKLLTSK